MSHTKCSGFAALTNKNPCALAHGQSQISPLKNPWQALRAATEKAAREGDSVAEKSILELLWGIGPAQHDTDYKLLLINRQ